MANLPETPQWESGIYQIETTDPVVGGPDGISNLQAKQLANRTAYLKQIADEVVDARGGKSSLSERLDQYDAFSPDNQNALWAAVLEAISEAGLANREIQKILNQRIQTGITTIYNRGVINGCQVTPSTTATRNLNLSAGRFFMHASVFSVGDMENSASVPPNNTSADAVCYSYIYVDSNGNIQHSCTGLNENAPDNSLVLYKIIVPAGNDEESDPNLSNCTLVDLRRMEPGYPTYFLNAPFIYVPLKYSMLDENYSVDLDIVSFEGSGFELGYVYVSDRTANGFKINSNGTVDTIVIRWTAKKINL